MPKLALLAKAIKVIPSLCLRFGINVPKRASLAKAHRKALTQKLCEGVVSAQILDKLTPRASYEFLKDKLGVTSLAESDCDIRHLQHHHYAGQG